MSTFEDLKNQEYYKRLIQMLSEEERKQIETSLKDFLETFDIKVLKSFEIPKQK